jgi:hypothetical protein
VEKMKASNEGQTISVAEQCFWFSSALTSHHHTSIIGGAPDV